MPSKNLVSIQLDAKYMRIQVSGGVYTLEYVGSFTGGRLRVPPTGGVEFTFCLSRPISKGEEVFIRLGLFTSGGERVGPANLQKEIKKPLMKTAVFVPDGLMHVRNESPKCISERFLTSSSTAIVHPTCPADLPVRILSPLPPLFLVAVFMCSEFVSKGGIYLMPPPRIKD